MLRPAIRSLAALALFAALRPPAAARAEEPGAFERLEQKAERVEGLAAFLDRYVGRCPKGPEAAACRTRAKRARAEMTGRLYTVRLDPAAARMLRAGGIDKASGRFRFELTPFFDAGGLGLTAGKPLGLDRQGRPRIRTLRLQAPLEDDQTEWDMERLLRTQNVRIELVFRPQGVWSLPARPERLEGMRAKFVAVRLSHARTGRQLALRLDE